MSPEVKELWGKTPDDVKTIILQGKNKGIKPSNNYNKNSFNSYKPKSTPFESVKPPNYSNNSFTKADLHQLLSELFVEEEEPADVKDSDNAQESNMLVNSTSASKVNPGDIHKLMSTSNKSKSTSTAIIPATTKSTFKSEIIVDGKTHKEVSKCVTYNVSKTSRTAHLH